MQSGHEELVPRQPRPRNGKDCIMVIVEKILVPGVVNEQCSA